MSCDNCYKFDERAAIAEFLGRMDRDKAEEIARADVCRGCKYAQADMFRNGGICDRQSVTTGASKS